jgi:hypothetical protein
LLNTFKPKIGEAEAANNDEEIAAFSNAIMATPVMKLSPNNGDGNAFRRADDTAVSATGNENASSPACFLDCDDAHPMRNNDDVVSTPRQRRRIFKRLFMARTNKL